MREKLRADGAFRLRLEVPDEEGLANGLRVYGDRLGRYAVDPTLRVSTGMVGHLPPNIAR